MPPTHRLYIEDSGTKEYSPSGQYGASNTRYFVFGGVLIEVRKLRELIPRIRRLKLATFGTEDVELKSNWLRRPKERQSRYLEPFGVTNEQLDAFVELYYLELREAPFQFIAGVVDKVQMCEQYEKPWYPPAAAYEVVMQRAEVELRDKSTFSAVVDDMTGATPKANQYKMNLIRQHRRMRQRGSSLMDGFNFTAVRDDVRFVNSRRSEMIQVADIAAYNVFRQFTEYGEAWETSGLKKLPTYEYFARLLSKFRLGPDNRIQGYGIVKLPRRGRIPWRVRKSDE